MDTPRNDAPRSRRSDRERFMDSMRDADASGVDRVLRQAEVLALVGVSRPTWWDWRRRKIAPEPDVVMGPRDLLGWRRSTVERWLATQRATVQG